MAFIKRGDAQPIISVHEGDPEQLDEETKKALEAAKQAAKNIDEDGNKIEFNKKSSG
jgi:hypothetical protein